MLSFGFVPGSFKETMTKNAQLLVLLLIPCTATSLS